MYNCFEQTNPLINLCLHDLNFNIKIAEKEAFCLFSAKSFYPPVAYILEVIPSS